ncbi:RagB/SusD family nutrient uptake outer membrane protein [Bacteroides sp.]|uniref:RagB/SusD family nutrient uptake outer membrane protein n=1 Tax=Bacteroides sp. TaxID=29523 RepID=UPI001B684C86|nr:RagB/SusD family nutrient uptake outer membrane protein [Bacteroides sp.]MBP6065622.1 RagB/SusD family nutrient uptake outer membrane protein [Bacteroides sp.]MBP6066611.1 RagB/SusD family nutrient uptake outer membrane protein [Bacteroides sp.]MBP6936650.1 RagB/SusD family nutrient uptake outer membrane protein [Bacteroides sp.]MBP8621588.1 RagB/SusD family nutrient uptake outer membrane protein [Bacteroides sp.]MBP9586928.1 RagB/SusD family nutrient uptake outer membrane protein [Bacteroi
MKKRIYIASLAIAGLLLTTSCNDLLDTPAKSAMDKQIIFSNPDLAMNAVMGIHQSFSETNSYRGRFIKYYGYNTDIEWNSGTEKINDAKSTLGNYNTESNNSEMNTSNNAWAKLYEGIERANQAIDGIRTYGNPTPGTLMGQILGEALTIRAVVYSDLLKAWGDVPARLAPVNPNEIYIGRSDRDVVYKQLIADLNEATDLCGWANSNVYTKSIEHVSKTFVLGLKARICLAAGGYGLRQDKTVRRSTDPELASDKMYAEALAACKRIINESGQKLEATFDLPFKKNLQDNLTAGGENLWEIPFSDGRGRVVFDQGIPHASIDKYTGQNKGGQYGCPLPTVYYDYDARDTRRDVTTVCYQWAKPKTAATAQQEPTGSIVKWWFGKYRYEWMTRYVTSTNDDGVNHLYMRLAEVYLMAAECENEVGTLDAAKEYLKVVRNRAFAIADRAEKVDAYLAKITNKAQMFNAIVDENSWEFCGERLRKENLIRWNLLEVKLAEAKVKLAELNTGTGRYSGKVADLLYYKTDGENVIFFGLQPDEVAKIEQGQIPEGFSLVGTDGKWKGKIDQAKIDGLYTTTPANHMYWPIWENFISGSNGTLDNTFLGK